MKAFYKIGLIGFFLCIAGNALADFYYTFRADNWTFPTGLSYKSARFKYYLENGDIAIIYLAPGTPSVSFTTTKRIISVDRHIEYTQNGVDVIDDQPNLQWPSNDMHMYPGPSPLWPVLYYNTSPPITIVAKQDGVTLLPGSVIDFGKAIQIEVTRNGYPGPLPMYFGSSSALSNNVLFTIPAGVTIDTVVLSDYWSKLSTLFGGDYEVVKNSFYFGFKYTVNEYGVIAQTNVLGRFGLTGNLMTNLLNTQRLCTTEAIICSIQYINTPYIVYIKQGTDTEKTLTFYSSPITLDYNTIRTAGEDSNNFEIYVYHIGYPLERTNRIYLTYLRKPPNITNFSVTPEDVSCTGKTDGKFKISLPNALPNELSIDSFRYNIVNSLNFVALNFKGLNEITSDTLPTGNYNITVEYVYSDPALNGCYAELGSRTIGVKPRLAITNITESKQSCSYKNDAAFTITTLNGVGDIDYILNGITSDTNIVGSLSPGTNYILQAIDSKGCTSDTTSRRPVAIAPLSISQNKTTIRCFGETGSVTLTGSGGHNSYQFSLDGGLYKTSNIFSDIPGNTNHIIEMRDATLDGEACVTSVPLFFEEPPELRFKDTSYTVSKYNGYNIKCHGENSGQISLKHSGGTKPINFKLNNGSKTFEQLNDPDFLNLEAGIYNASLTDSNGCIALLDNSIELIEPEGITFSNIVVTPETCNGTKDASISLNLSSVADSLQWYMSGNPIMDENNSLIDSLVPGVYRLEAFYNSKACTSLSDYLPVDTKTPIDFTATYHESCSNGNGGGEIQINRVTNGRQPLTCVFNNGTSSALSGFPVIFSDLDPGEYALEVRDSAYIMGGIYAEKCKVSKSILIEAKENAVITPVITNPLCQADSNGSILATINGPDNPYIQAWYNSADDSIGTGTILTGIPKGEFSALIKDTFQCSIIQTGFILNEPEKLAFSGINLVKAGCTEIKDGQIQINARGGTLDYSYSADSGTTWQLNNSFAGLKVGKYRLLARDAHACAIDTAVVLNAFVPLLTELTYDSVTCFGRSDAKLKYSASGSKYDGFGYSYFIYTLENEGFSNAIGQFNNLDKDTYYSYAKDNHGCSTDTLIREVWEPDELSVKLKIIDSASCGQYTGKIGYTVSGGNGGYTLLWYNDETGETPFIDTTALRTGYYSLSVTDRKLCAESSSVIVPDRPAPVITDIELIDSAWCGLPLGAVQVNVTSGSPRYTYRWDNAENDTTAIADNLTEGIYNVIVTDRYNCSDYGSIEITDGPELALNTQIELPHCGQKDGNVELIVSGGVMPYLFHWPDSVAINPVSNPIMNNLFSGIYPVEISDKIGCKDTFYITLSDISGPVINATAQTKSWCKLPRGTAEVFATGGTLPYNYSWSTNGSDIIGTKSYIDSLKSGNYIVRITDSDNCKALKNISITDSLELQPELDLVAFDSAACNKPLGKLFVSMSEGQAPYSYKWNTGMTGDSLVNISQGTYKVVATDNRGCKDSLDLRMPDRKLPQIRLLSKESAYCGKLSGKATFTASLGKSPYMAYLSSNPENKVLLTYHSVQNRYEGTMDSLLPLPAPYLVKLSDANGCVSDGIGVVINDNNPLLLELKDISPVSCYGLSDGHALVNVSNGFEPYTFTWSKNSVNSNFNNALSAGPFNVIVTDNKSCVKTLYVTATPITEPEPLTLGSSFITHPSCYGLCDARIEAFAAGGNGGYVYIWNDADTTQTGTKLCSGENTLKIVDSKGCHDTRSFEIVNPEPLSGTDLPDEVTICSGQHYFANPGNEWTGVSWTSDNGFASDLPIADIDRYGDYYMTGYSDKGCRVVDTIKIIVSDDLLDAEFLMMSQAYAGDTVVIIEVTWPVAETYDWELPESASILNDNGFYKELVFDESGTYYVQLTATLAGCSSVKGKYIEILDISEKPEEEKLSESPALIKSFNVYPNPAVKDFNADIQLSEQKDIRVEIISISGGNLIRVMTDYGLNNYKVNVNVEELLRGTYIIRLIAGSEAKTKILIVR